MVDVLVTPRVENPDSDTESIASSGWCNMRPSKAYVAGGQWVMPVWPKVPKNLTGVALTFKLDALPDVPYELKVNMPDGAGKRYEFTEFRIVAGGGPVAWETLVQVDGPGGGAVLTDVVDARLDALEAANPSGGASDVSEVGGISAFAITYLDDTSASATLATLGAAPLASPTFTGTPAAPTPTAGDADTSIATTAFVDTSFAKKASPALTGTPTAPTAAGGTSTTQIATTAFVAGAMGGSFTTANPVFTGTTDLVNLDVSGTAAFAAGAIAQAAVANLTTDITAKAPLASPVFTGNPTAPTPAPGDSDTSIATTAFVQALLIAYGIEPRVRWTGTAWQTRASKTPTGYTGPVEFYSPYDSTATPPTDRIVTATGPDLWTRKPA